MSRLEKPLNYDILWATGDLLLRAQLDLLLKDNAGNWRKQTFRVDTGSDITSMPAFRGKQLGLPMPTHGISLPLTTVVGQVTVTVRSGYLRFQVVGMDQTEYAVSCHFLGDPDTPPDPSAPPAAIPKNLLALSGVVDKLRLTFDGTSSLTAPHGNLIVEKK